MSGNATELISQRLLREWPLPMPLAQGDKEQRGSVLIIAGSREMPGAAMLAAEAALRAGAGKLAIATGASVAQLVAASVPESRVIGVDETADGSFVARCVDRLARLLQNADAVLIGPGMTDDEVTTEFTHAVLAATPRAQLVLDAAAMNVVRGDAAAQRLLRPALLTPHAGEMAHLTGEDKDSVLADPLGKARQSAGQWNAVVALKGATTCIASPDGRVWQHDGGNVGLAVSGSGDVLAGLIAGFAARGATLEQAAAWGVFLHARAGDTLAQDRGPLGYLARELAIQIPAMMRALSC